MRPARRSVRVDLPGWVADEVAWERPYDAAQDRMRLAVGLARRNVLEGTGGPFGAAVFEASTGRLVSAGVNVVVARRNSVLHAEVVAVMLAEARLGSHSLAGAPHELVASCEPCAMCLGAALWSGVGRLVCGATGEDARAAGFDEGPVFPESYAYLERRGVEVVRGVLREEARAVLELYVSRGGPIYNP
jgi:tRNA(Arg) A34 adenosine deaminase TadA